MKNSNTAGADWILKENYKRQWYIDLEIFQEAQILESQMLFEQHKINQQKIQQDIKGLEKMNETTPLAAKSSLGPNEDDRSRKNSLEAGTEAVDMTQDDHETHSICSSDIAQIQKR